MNRALGVILIVVMLAMIGFLSYIMFFRSDFDSLFLGRRSSQSQSQTSHSSSSSADSDAYAYGDHEYADDNGTGDGTDVNGENAADEKLYNRIRIAYDMADTERAVGLISDFLADYPGSPFRDKVILCAASLFYDRKDYQKSRQYIVNMLKNGSLSDEDFVNGAILMGKIQRDSGVYEAVANNYLENAYFKADAVKKRELAVFMGYSYLYRKDHVMATRYFTEAGGEYNLIGMARVYIDQGKYADAIQAYLNFFALYPESPNYKAVTNAFLKQCWFFAGQLKNAKYNDRAIEYYTYIVNNFPNEFYADDSLYNIGEIYQAKKVYDKAILYYNKVLANRIPSSDDRAAFAKATVYYEQGRKAEAVQMFQFMLENYPRSTLCARADEWIELISKELQYE